MSLIPASLELKPYVFFATSPGAHTLGVGWRSADSGLFLVELSGIFFLRGLLSHWATLLVPYTVDQACGKSSAKQLSPILGQRGCSETQMFPMGMETNTQAPGAALPTSFPCLDSYLSSIVPLFSSLCSSRKGSYSISHIHSEPFAFCSLKNDSDYYFNHISYYYWYLLRSRRCQAHIISLHTCGYLYFTDMQRKLEH